MENNVLQRIRLREPTTNGKLIGRALLRLFAQMSLNSGVTEVEVVAKDLAPVVWKQLDLFGTPAIEHNRLSDLLETLALRLGSECVYQI